jgi:WD40 repeat protein
LAIIRRRFEGELPNWIQQCPRVEESWSQDTQTLEGHSDAVHSVAFSADGRLLASSSCDNTIKLWDPSTGVLKNTLEGHSDLVHPVAFSADGRLLASSSCDNTIKLWDPSTGVLKHTLEGHSNPVQSVAFSADGRLLASGSWDNTIKLWDPSTGALRHTIRADGVVINIEFSFPYLVTNLGSFNIQAWHESFSSDSSRKNIELSLQADRWVTIQGRLPLDYQPIASTVKDGAIALGCKNGRVYIITFSM